MLQEQSFKIILTKVSIIMENKDPYDYYDIHKLEELNLTTDNYHKCRFFNVDEVITFNNKRYIIKNISFRLDPVGHTDCPNLNINDNDPSDNNVTLLVFVEDAE